MSKWLDEILPVPTVVTTKDGKKDETMTLMARYFMDNTKQAILSHIEEALKTPDGHISDEECCDACDVRAEIRAKLLGGKDE